MAYKKELPQQLGAAQTGLVAQLLQFLMLGFVEPSPNVNVSSSVFHSPFPRASARHMGPGAPASAFGTPNAMLAHPVRDVRFLRAKLFRETYTRPRSVPTDLFSTFVSSQRVYWKNDE